MVASAIIRRRRGSTSLLSLYSALGIRPDLALDFDNERYFVDRVPTTFASAITHTRASTATYVDSTGTLQTAAINEPRVGHHVWNGTAWVNEGLLHESEARTNLVDYSQDFTQWTATGTPTLATTVGPDGGAATAYTITDDSTSSFEFIRKSISVPDDSLSRTVSLFVKKTTGATSSTFGMALNYTGGTGVGNIIKVNTDTGIRPYSVDAGELIEDWGDWWRLSVTVANNGTGNTNINLDIYPALSAHNGTSDTVTATGSHTIFGAQLEAAPTPSSYIPTSGSTVTRAADVLTIPSANLPWPTPNVIGPELVTNGTFDTDTTGWTAGTGLISVSSGQMTIDRNSATLYDVAYQEITTEIGKVYKLDFDVIDDGVSNLFKMIVRTPAFSLIVNKDATTGSHTVFFVATTTTSYVHLVPSGTTTNTAIVDNISVREINPLAVSIQMDGRVTYADLDTGPDPVQFMRWPASGSDYIVHYLQTIGVGRTGQIRFAQNTAGVFDSAATDLDYLSANVLTPFNIAGRHGSNFVNGAAGGVALIADTTPVALPDLSAQAMRLGHFYNGTIRTFRIWAQDIGDAGLVEATEPSLVPSLSLTFDGTENSFIVEDWSE